MHARCFDNAVSVRPAIDNLEHLVSPSRVPEASETTELVVQQLGTFLTRFEFLS